MEPRTGVALTAQAPLLKEHGLKPARGITGLSSEPIYPNCEQRKKAPSLQEELIVELTPVIDPAIGSFPKRLLKHLQYR
ncbi:hypothetical protein NDU88_006759 [Pleurodeles waltl]|uniref:Uncharacterized protein n=1 Tax=Pleurodeles waltl TaxID=8319 RepID=A0AAV7U112_PLEWA|nr:hypothetical protein NDU88_006759 [Pleurodeles waltl]